MSKLRMTLTQKITLYVFTIALVVVGTLVALGGQAGVTGSIVGSQTINTRPNVTSINSYLESQNVGVPQFAINTVSVITDSNGQKHNQVSSFLNLTPATLIGPDGILLDKGSIQTQVFAVGDDNQQMVISGYLSVYLDSKLVGQKHITGQGVTMNKNLPLLLDGDPALNFTFADEGTYNWVNGSKHSYTIYLSNIQATVGTGSNTKIYAYYGQFISYVVNMQVDNTHIVAKDVNGKQVSVFKADDSIKVVQGFVPKVIGSTVSVDGNPNWPVVKVLSNGFTLDPNAIPRNSNVTFNIDGKDYNVQTPLTQYSYIINCDSITTEKDLAGSNTAVSIIGSKCTSNFGYSK